MNSGKNPEVLVHFQVNPLAVSLWCESQVDQVLNQRQEGKQSLVHHGKKKQQVHNDLFLLDNMFRGWMWWTDGSLHHLPGFASPLQAISTGSLPDRSMIERVLFEKEGCMSVWIKDNSPHSRPPRTKAAFRPHLELERKCSVSPFIFNETNPSSRVAPAQLFGRRNPCRAAAASRASRRSDTNPNIANGATRCHTVGPALLIKWECPAGFSTQRPNCPECTLIWVKTTQGALLLII